MKLFSQKILAPKSGCKIAELPCPHVILNRFIAFGISVTEPVV